MLQKVFVQAFGKDDCIAMFVDGRIPQLFSFMIAVCVKQKQKCRSRDGELGLQQTCFVLHLELRLQSRLSGHGSLRKA